MERKKLPAVLALGLLLAVTAPALAQEHPAVDMQTQGHMQADRRAALDRDHVRGIEPRAGVDHRHLRDHDRRVRDREEWRHRHDRDERRDRIY